MVTSYFLLEVDLAYCNSSLSVTDTTIDHRIIQFVFCSDVHFGLKKEIFRGRKKVTSKRVNAAMIMQMNRLTQLQLPQDNGVNAGERIQGIDALTITGDIANREEAGVQSATKSWKEFSKSYLKLFSLKNFENIPTPVLVTPGNHDVSNAIGFRRPMRPLKDAASLLGMYNLMMRPVPKKNKTTFQPGKDIVHYSYDIGTVHCIFIQLWPDSAERIWIEKDLLTVSDSTPVFLFTHSIPDVEARFFINPNGSHDINDQDKFENLLSENFKDGYATTDTAFIEQRMFAAFIKTHPNIKAYFHGHNNYTEFYDWKGPDKNINLHCFRVDSPMKGRYSATDETKLAFELVSFDTGTQKITVRECLWNKEPLNPAHPISWGNSITMSLNQ